MFGSGRSLQLMRVFGIRIGVNLSWFVVLFLFVLIFQSSFQDSMGGSESDAFIAAVLAAGLFFGSIILHELGHAIAARRAQIDVEGIDLFFFGGIMRMSRDTDSAGREFKVAVAGPIVTLLIAGAGFAVGAATMGMDEFLDAATISSDAEDSMAAVLLGFVVSVNAALFLFNMIPAYPLDGGRIARSIAWRVTGDRTRATRMSARLGQALATVGIGYGLFLAIATDHTLNGIWLAFLCYMLLQSARSTVVQTMVMDRLDGITVADVMDAEPVAIPAELPALRAWDEFFLRYHGWPWFAVVEADGRFVGLAQRQAVEHAALSEGGAMPVRDVVATADAAASSIPADAPLEHLLGSRPLLERGALMAVDAQGRLRGVVTREMVSRTLAARLSPPASPSTAAGRARTRRSRSRRGG